MPLKTLELRLEAEASKLHNELDRSKKKLKRFERNADSASDRIKRLGKVGFTAFTAMAVPLGFLAKRTLDTADKFGKLSTRLGVSTEALSQLKHVADLSGVSFETMTMGLQRMTRRVAEAAQGSGEAINALKELGVSAVALNKLDLDQQFEVLAEAISKVENPADRVRLAMKLFDSEGVALIQTMEGGAEGIRKMRQEADELGLTMSGKLVKAAERTNDNLTRLTAAMQGVFLKVMAQALPHIERITKSMVKWAKETKNVADALAFLGNAMKVSATGALILKEVFVTLGKSIGAAAAAIMAAAHGDFERATDILIARAEDLEKEWSSAIETIESVWQDVPKRIESSAPETAERIASPIVGAGEIVEETAKDIENRLKKLKKDIEKVKGEAASINQEFARRAETVATGQTEEKPGEDLTVLDVSHLQRQAERALSQGDFSSAVDKARQAFDLLDKMKDAGVEADIVLRGMAARLQRLGERIGKEKLAKIQTKVEVDQAGAIDAAKRSNQAMQAFLASNPLVQLVEIRGGNATIVPNSENGSAGNNMRPVDITIPGIGTVPLQGNQSAIDSLRRTIQRDALQSGSR